MLPIYITLLPLLSSLTGASPLERRAAPAVAGYNRVFLEEFTGALTNNWVYDLGTNYPNQVAQWGTGEIQKYTKDATNIKTSGGILSITPRRKLNAKKTYDWTSARIETKKGLEWGCADGKKMLIQASIKLGSASEAQQKGIWPAFWMLGSVFRDRGNKGWPEVGEWDIMESVNGLRRAWGLAHCGIYDGQKKIKGPCNEPDGRGGYNAIGRGLWNTFGLEIDRTSKDWKKEKITWIVNGARRQAVIGSQVNNQTAWDFLAHRKFFILLNVAVGGSFPNGVAQTYTPFKETIDGDAVGMQVDWVAVYQQQ